MSGRTSAETVIGLTAAAVFALAGAALVALGAYIHHRRSTLLADGLKTSGVIVRFERVAGPSGPGTLSETILVPAVKFTTSSGRDITFLGSTNAKPPWADYKSGATVGVVYDPQHPANARIDTLAELWFAPGLLWLVGGGALFIPPLTIWRHLRSKAPRGV